MAKLRKVLDQRSSRFLSVEEALDPIASCSILILTLTQIPSSNDMEGQIFTEYQV